MRWLLLLLVAGCVSAGAGAGGGRATGDGDGDGDGDEAVDAAVDGDASVGDAGAGLPRCEGATIDFAPSGAPCNIEHLVRGGLGRPCYGFSYGQFCDQIGAVLGSNEGEPPGFTCTFFDATRTCVFAPNGESGPMSLDGDALESLCAVTVSHPDLILECTVFEN